jgi:glutaredoxin-like protein NrdH
LRRKGITAKKVLVDENPEALEYIKGLGYSEAPVIVVTDGDKVIDHWSGFSDDKLRELKELVAA